MIIIVDNWIKSVKNNIKYQKTQTPELRKYCKRFSDKYIREKIYDYLAENLAIGIDGTYKIIIRTKDNSESIVLSVLEHDENHLLCKEELPNQVFYVTKLQAKVDIETDKLCGVDLTTAIGYKKW